MLVRLFPILVFVATSRVCLPAQPCPEQASSNADNGTNQSRVSRPVDPAVIQELVGNLESTSAAERDAAKRHLIAIGRDVFEELFKALDSGRQPLVDRAKEVFDAVPKASLNVHDATDRAITHATVEFFALMPHSTKLRDKPFASEVSDVWGGIAIPDAPGKGDAMALRIHLPEYGTTTITRLSPADLSEIRKERRRRQYRYLWLPVVPQDSEHAKRAVRGVVQDQSGKPVPCAEVDCRYAFSPTETMINGIHPRSSVVADDGGQFRLYQPRRYYAQQSSRARYPFRVRILPFDPVISTEVVPDDSEYQLTVRVPHDLSFRPVQLSHDLSSAAVIRLARTDRVRRFEFESLAGALITVESELAKIVLRYRPPDAQRPLWLDADEWLDVDQRIVMGGGPTHTGYYWASYKDSSGETVSWEIQRIDDTSPDVIRLRSPPPVVFRGRVLDGTTGKPLAGVFVASIRSHMAEQSLTDVTSDEWDAVERLPEKPSLDAAALEPIQRTYTLRSLVRTDSDGRYELVQQPDDRFSSVRAIARNKLDTSVDVHEGEQFSDVPDLLMFPAAKIRLRASQIQRQIFVRWSLPPGDQPKWLSTLQDYVRNSLHHGVQSYRRVSGGCTLSPKSPIWMSVPAGLRFRLEGESGRDPWRRLRLGEAAPKIRIVDGTVYRLEEGAAVDLGELPLKPPLVVQVQVVGPKMQPVANVDVQFVHSRRLEPSWSSPVPTNEQGIAELHVSQDTRKLRLGATGGELFSTNYFTEEIEIEWAGPLPEEPIRIELSEEQVRILAEQQGD
jgi:hypothetical protein